MLICSIDTSGREGSVALAEGDAESFRVLYSARISGGTYSAQLVPEISAALKSSGRAKSDIGLLVVASGPGSFTGLRVGLSTVKALAEVLQAPIVAISVLEATAFATRKSGLLITVLDAQRSEVYVGEYDIEFLPGAAPIKKLVREGLLRADEFTAWVAGQTPPPVSFTPDASVEKRLRDSKLPVEFIARPAADSYAELGLYKYLAGETTAADTLDPNYMRHSDAELFGSPKTSPGN